MCEGQMEFSDLDDYETEKFDKQGIYTVTPVSCSNAGHRVRFRTGVQDGCDTCGVDF